jgi:hypothetical protein
LGRACRRPSGIPRPRDRRTATRGLRAAQLLYTDVDASERSGGLTLNKADAATLDLQSKR